MADNSRDISSGLPENYVDAPAPSNRRQDKRLSLRDRVVNVEPSKPQAEQPVQWRAKETIRRVSQQTRSPWAKVSGIRREDLEDLEDSLREHQEELERKERALLHLQQKLEERDRDLRESEALIQAQRAIIEAAEGREDPYSEETKQAMLQLKKQLEDQEAHLRQTRQMLREREQYIQQSEERLLNKTQEQQVKEAEMEQEMERIRYREEQLQAREMALQLRKHEVA